MKLFIIYAKMSLCTIAVSVLINVNKQRTVSAYMENLNRKFAFCIIKGSTSDHQTAIWKNLFGDRGNMHIELMLNEQKRIINVALHDIFFLPSVDFLNCFGGNFLFLLRYFS